MPTPEPYGALPRLVYCEESWAFFTTREDWQESWGDDWNDAPYEHNAGRPYAWRDGDTRPQWEIVQVGYDHADLLLPNWGHLNSPLSVEEINAGAAPWLAEPSWATHGVNLHAGVDLIEFVTAVQKIGGTVFTALAPMHAKDRSSASPEATS